MRTVTLLSRTGGLVESPTFSSLDDQLPQRDDFGRSVDKLNFL